MSIKGTDNSEKATNWNVWYAMLFFWLVLMIVFFYWFTKKYQ